ncbi:MAG: DUF4384 domain-containing protein, partial [Deltaproteobacteria bacterium]|nr:DUF4384 domain-containing protein [Deltaproteobacteria bacterium]
DGSVTIEELYQYVYENTKAVTAGKQNPQMYPIIKQGDRTPIFAVPTFKDALNVDVSFQYVDENNEVRPLTDGADLRSGSLVGVSFRPESDCFVYIMWRDSSGQMGRLFPNPELTEGNVVAKAGKNYWLPMKGGEEAQDRWYMLDDAPGEETIYFVASRERNPKLEQLYESLTRLGDSQRRGAEGKDLTREMEREMNLMGFASQTATRKKAVSPRQDDAEKRFEDLKNKIEVAGADLVYAVKFKHLADRTASR